MSANEHEETVSLLAEILKAVKSVDRSVQTLIEIEENKKPPNSKIGPGLRVVLNQPETRTPRG